MPRLARKQKHRCNHPAGSIEHYYRRSVYIPLLDTILTDLKTRFKPDALNAINLAFFLPKNIIKKRIAGTSETIIAEISCQYFSILSSHYVTNKETLQEILNGETSIWRQRWVRQNEGDEHLPLYAIDAYMACDGDIFPTIKVLLKILCTLPVSVASAERSFSTLRRLKNWMRSKMGEDRLSGLAMLATHRSVDINIEKVIDRFAKQKNRKLNFVL
jgi:hypothetical protein